MEHPSGDNAEFSTPPTLNSQAALSIEALLKIFTEGQLPSDMPEVFPCPQGGVCISHSCVVAKVCLEGINAKRHSKRDSS